MKIMEQVRTHGGQVFPFPRPDEIVYETPPSFVWIGADSVKRYKIEVRCADGTADGKTVWTKETAYNTAVPEIILHPQNMNIPEYASLLNM